MMNNTYAKEILYARHLFLLQRSEPRKKIYCASCAIITHQTAKIGELHFVEQNDIEKRNMAESIGLEKCY